MVLSRHDRGSQSTFPDDIGALKALVLHLRREQSVAAKDAELARAQDANARLWETLRQLRRAQFGRKSEKLDPDQLSLAMEETEQAIAETGATEETSNATLKASPKKPRSVNRGTLPSHLPREEIVIEPESTACPCCGGAMHVMGEDRSERLDVTPAQFKVIVTRRPKYACRACEDAVVQAPAPARADRSRHPNRKPCRPCACQQIRRSLSVVSADADL